MSEWKPKVRINSEYAGLNTKIEFFIDGEWKDVSHCIRRLEISIGAGQMNQVSCHLTPAEIHIIGEQAELHKMLLQEALDEQRGVQLMGERWIRKPKECQSA